MAQDRLKALFVQIAKEHNYLNYDVDIRPVSSDGSNYTTVLFLASISAPLRNNIELFAKVSDTTEEMRSHIANISKIYDIEFYFYDKLFSIYEDLQVKHNLPQEHRLVVPKVYKTNTKYLEEMLVLENLLAKGYKVYDRLKPMTYEYAATAVSTLAKLHSLSFAYKQENIKEFEVIIEKLPIQTGIDEVSAEMYKNQMMPDIINSVKEENRGKFKKFFDETDVSKEWIDLIKNTDNGVIVHNDYRVSNLMHTRRNGKLQIIPIDFQTVTYGNPVSDLMYLIFTGSDSQFRKYHYTNLLEHYYTELTEALKRLDLDINYVYPREDYKHDLKKLRMFGLIVGVTILPYVTVSADDAPKISAGAEASDFAIKPNDLYVSRINGILDDYIQLGLL